MRAERNGFSCATHAHRLGRHGLSSLLQQFPQSHSHLSLHGRHLCLRSLVLRLPLRRHVARAARARPQAALPPPGLRQGRP